MRILVFMCVLLSAVGSYAQSGWYIKAGGGVGAGNIKAATFIVNGISIPIDYKNVTTYDGGIGAGYRKWNIDISTGVQLLGTGQKLGITLGADSGFVANRFKHLLIPLQIGYQVHIIPKLSVIPQIGVAYSHNFNRVDHVKLNAEDTRTNVGDTVFKYMYKRSGLFGMAHLNIEYMLSDRLSICITPSYYYMLSSFDNPPAYGNYNPMEHPYAWCLDAGVVWRLKRKATVSPTPAQ